MRSRNFRDMLFTLKAISGFIILLALSVSIGKQYLADRYYPADTSSLWQNIETSGSDAELTVLLHKAIKLTPTNADYYYKLANLYIKETIKPTVWNDITQRNKLIGEAIKNAQRAIYLNPSNSRYYIASARAYALLRPVSFHLKSLAAFEKAGYLSPSNAEVRYKAGSYYLNNWKYLSPRRQTKAIEILKKAVELDEDYFDSLLAAAWRTIGDYKLVQRIVPGSIIRHRNFAKFLIKQQMLKEYAVEMARVEYLLAEKGQRGLAEKGKTEGVLRALEQVAGYYRYVRKNFPAYLDDSFNKNIDLSYAGLYLDRAKRQLKKGDSEAAIESLSHAAKKVPVTDSELLNEIARQVIGIKVMQNDADLQLLKAGIWYKQGNYPAAIKLLGGLEVDLLDTYQRTAAFSLLGRCYKEEGRLREAKDVADRMDYAAVKLIKQSSWTGRAEAYARKYVYQNGEMYWAGTISAPLILKGGQEGLAEFIIKAKASPANGSWPVMVVRVDDEILDVVCVSNLRWQDFHFRFPLTGDYQGDLKISFVNDGGNSQRHEDRNLYIGDAILCSEECDTA